MDGNYGDYVIEIDLAGAIPAYSCTCPYPGPGCKHTVAALLDVADRLSRIPINKERETAPPISARPAYLAPEEIREQVVEDRRKRAAKEGFEAILGDMFAGEHLVITPRGRQYTVTMHDPLGGKGHCDCPDYLSNRLGTCKHLIFLAEFMKSRKGFRERAAKERFPFADIHWDSESRKPRLFHAWTDLPESGAGAVLGDFFTEEGMYRDDGLHRFPELMARVEEHKEVRIRESVLQMVSEFFDRQALADMDSRDLPSLSPIKATLYPYQREGVRFALHKKAALIGDEMGLGKTLQAIALGMLKKEVFGFSKILVVTLASLKDQWRREIERFTDERGVVIAGSFKERRRQYLEDKCLFKITNYEAVLRDADTIGRYKPDLVILDEAQRIKNFTTKTAETVKLLPRRHSLVLTGTPLENKLEDVYSIVQFLDPDLLAPLWGFAADHFMISREKKGRIDGYRNLDELHQKLKPLVLRRRKEEVLSDLPDVVTNSYYIDLHEKQIRHHNSCANALQQYIHKKYLTPMDIKRIQEILLSMRRVCDSTYLIDRRTNISPKLDELQSILNELVVQNRRKVVIFSEWTAMTFLIGKHLSEAAIPFVELSGRIPAHKRQPLIDEFTNNPECKVFLSTDAGGTGLNLQAADCVVNFEMPWNPAKLNQRIGRVNRIGQKSRSVNVINLIARNSIEERIVAGIQLKTDLFKGVFDGEGDMVVFSRERRNELLNQLRELMGDEMVEERRAQAPQEEIPEDTPHYLNPEVLDTGEAEAVAVDVTAEEEREIEPVTEVPDTREENAAKKENILASQPPEKIEQVLNSGLEFISGLLEMATGRKVERVAENEPLLRLDGKTGEVTMKFKLPGF